MADSDFVLFLDQSCRLTRWRWRFTLVGEGFSWGIYIDGETPPLDWGRSDESKRKSLQYLKIEQTSTLVSPKKWPSSAQTSVMCNLKIAFVNKHYQLPSMRCKSRKLWCKTSSQEEKQLGVCLLSLAWKSTNLQEKFCKSFKPLDLQQILYHQY